MYKAILDVLCCPACKAELRLQIESEIEGDVIEGTLHCACGQIYRIRDGIALFGSKEQEFANQWQELSDAEGFEAFDHKIDYKNPQEILDRRNLVLSSISAEVAKQQTVLDIASGRGLLLAELCKKLDRDTSIISTDLSAHVLRHDRHKFKALAPDKRISFLSCDATNLPLRDNTVDAAASYCGFSNMFAHAYDGLKEAHRVLRPDGILVDSYVVIEKESEGYNLLKKVCDEQNLARADTFFLQSGVMKHHENLFQSVECNVVFEGIGVGNDMDLLPYDGEWYAEQVYISKK